MLGSNMVPLPVSKDKNGIFHSVWLHFPVWARRWFYRFLLPVGRYMWPPYKGVDIGVQRLPFDLYAKYGGRIDKAEVAATRFIRKSTTINVPRIIDVVDDFDGNLFVIMSRLEGEPVGGRLTTMDQHARTQFTHDLRDWLHQLRSLPSSSEAISNFLGGSSLQYNIGMYKKEGPWPDIRSFHDSLIEGVSPSSDFRNLARELIESQYRVVLTHGDLTPTNILVDSQGRLSGLVDFGSCGWFPEYWDFVNAMWGKPKYYPEWAEVFRAIYPDYENEFKVINQYWHDHDPYYFY